MLFVVLTRRNSKYSKRENAIAWEQALGQFVVQEFLQKIVLPNPRFINNPAKIIESDSKA